MNPFLWLVWAVLLLVVLFVASAVVAAVFEAVRHPRCSKCKQRTVASRRAPSVGTMTVNIPDPEATAASIRRNLTDPRRGRPGAFD